MKDIKNYNDKGKLHGYQEWYCYDKLSLKGNIKNGRLIGYIEYNENKKIIFYVR
jgi:hypothetical protein